MCQLGKSLSRESHAIKVAKPSFSQSPSQYFIVTRLPNHMCAVSCSIVSAMYCLLSKALSSGFMSKAFVLNMMTPQFSIAPAEKSGTATRSSFGSGYNESNRFSKYSKPFQAKSRANSVSASLPIGQKMDSGIRLFVDLT